MVQITPNLLEFKGPFTSTSTEYIEVTNDGQETLAFKVKTTAPKLYCVRPNAASVEPGETVKISVIFLGLKSEPEPDFKCNDKFLIVSLPSPYPLGDQTVADVWSKLEAEFKPQSVSKKIKVAFVQDEEPAQKVEEEVSTAPAALSSVPVAEKVVEKTAEVKSADKSAKDELSTEERSKIDALNEKLDSNVSSSTEASSPASTTTAVSSQRPIPLTTILLFAIIAFIVGWLFF